jgi:ankyrin repeat protein
MMVKKFSPSKLSLLATLLLAMLLVQCRCGGADKLNEEQPASQKNQDETITPITDITDEMIARAKAGKRELNVKWEFLAKKLEALKGQNKDQNEVDINEQNEMEAALSALHYAALLGDVEIVQALLNRGGNPNIETKDKKVPAQDKITPLHLAVQSGNATIVQSLLDKGAKVNAKDGVDRTALEIAFSQNPLPAKIIQLLVSKLSKDEINEKDIYGNPFLYRALAARNKEIANIFLGRPDIDVNISNRSHTTPLHLALESGYVDIVQSLLDKGAKVNEKNIVAKTPLDIAFANNNLPVELMQLLVSKLSKDEINEKDLDGDTLVHRALDEKKKEVAKILLTHPDIDVDILGNYNDTLLHIAILCNYVDVVKILLDKGARLDRKNNSNRTPLELAEHKKFQEIIDLLKDRASKNP